LLIGGSPLGQDTATAYRGASRGAAAQSALNLPIEAAVMLAPASGLIVTVALEAPGGAVA
jgi:hypothetical protein